MKKSEYKKHLTHFFNHLFLSEVFECAMEAFKLRSIMRPTKETSVTI